MKSVKLSLLLILSFTLSFANATDLTGAHFIRTFEQLEALGKQQTTGAQSISMELVNRFNLAKDLPPSDFNFVVFELLNIYSKYPHLRTSIQSILMNLSQHMNNEIFDARQRFETPMVVARALLIGATIVGIARLSSTLYRMAHNGLNGKSISRTDSIEKVLSEPALTTNTHVRQPIGRVMMNATRHVYQNCVKSARCKYSMSTILTGTTVEAALYQWDIMSVQKVHPMQSLRIVQAHLGCELSWGIVEFKENWSKENQLEVAEKTAGFKKDVKEIGDSYSHLQNLYNRDLDEYKKYYPKSKQWLDIAPTIMEPSGRTCSQISTDAMSKDLETVERDFEQRYKASIKDILMENLKLHIILNNPYQEPLKHMFETPEKKEVKKPVEINGEQVKAKEDSEDKPAENDKPAVDENKTQDENKDKEKEGEREVPDFMKNKEEL